MPLAAATSVSAPPTWYNVSEYSHTTVITVTTLYNSKTQNVPPLLTWKEPFECKDRWMLIDNGPTLLSTHGATTIFQTRTPLGTVTSIITESPTPVVVTSAPPILTSAILKVIRNAIVVVKRQEPQISGSVPPYITRAFQYTAWSLDSDPLFEACRPYSSFSLYSPGMCPDGQTVAEVTEVHATGTGTSTTVHTYWHASCCSRQTSGMTFGSDVSRFCISTITSAIPAHVDLIKSHSDSNAEPVYESLLSTFTGSVGSESDGYSTSTISEITTLTHGLAVGDPVVIAWAMEDFSKFPASYATSLAGKIGVVLAQTAPPEAASSSSLARQTGLNESVPPPPLATGTKVGIGVCAALGVAVMVGFVVFIL
ncbi:hypothetical protein T440DRAFT_543490 [Plenodomus tracheiphilus IPT5]|uniref:Uncharacterized protein n=1 Tax=Plenodomus tracheiphilus IPT5 TaxID=1408161 RepID=A0A6A7ARP5_9PLEO|nr:hypothetical protein T440DRAFT_543490 [Plenodomus tracheiphilus IPT5]